MGVLIINNRNTPLERTAALAKGDLNVFYWYQMFAQDSVVDEAQTFELAWRLQAAKTTITSHKVRKASQGQELIQSSTTPDPGYTWGSQPFPSVRPQGSNKQTRQHDKHKKKIAKMIHKETPPPNGQ